MTKMSYDHNIRHPDRTILSVELLYICDLKGEWLGFIYTFSQLLPGLVAGAHGRYVLCGVGDVESKYIVCIFPVATGIVLLVCRHAYQIGVTAQVSARVSNS